MKQRNIKYLSNLMGAGIVPVAKYNNKLYFLFGKEQYGKNWSDFGGKSEKNETKMETAIREGYEELDGFFGSKTDIKNMVNNNFIIKLDTMDKKYCSYLFKCDYEAMLPLYFNNHHKFIQKNLPVLVDKNGLFEKSEIKWFTIEDLIKEYTSFRNFYKSIVNNIIINKDLIITRIGK